MRFFRSCLALLIPFGCQSVPYPIQFSIPEEKIVPEIPAKDLDFAIIIPGDPSTYISKIESDYYHDYQRAFYGLTTRKAGWDCLRHYEILANGCIPYFPELERCDPHVMALLPKALILEAMHLEGVDYPKIDHTRFNRSRYDEILQELLAYTRDHLTTRNMANYVLQTANYTGNGEVLFLSDDPFPDYLRCLTLIGLKQLLGERCVDVPKIEHIYQSYSGNVKELYGRGFTYTKIVEDIPVDRDHIKHRIRNRDFDLIIYGSVHRGLRYHDLVKRCYSPNQIIYLCGEDSHSCQYRDWNNLFLREWD